MAVTAQPTIRVMYCQLVRSAQRVMQSSLPKGEHALEVVDRSGRPKTLARASFVTAEIDDFDEEDRER